MRGSGLGRRKPHRSSNLSSIRPSAGAGILRTVPAPRDYVRWVNANVGFNPRGQAHSDYLTGRIFADLARVCRPFARAMNARELELRPNVGLNGVRQAVAAVPAGAEHNEPIEIDTNIDGVIFALPKGRPRHHETSPIALENKTIMTAHGKARKNRYGDMRAFASHVHSQNPEAIAAFAMIVNTALDYRNPDAFARSAKKTGTNKPEDAANTIGLFTSGTVLRDSPTEPLHRVEALLILALNYNGIDATAKLVAARPAPGAGSPFSYAGFLDRLCRLYSQRFP